MPDWDNIERGRKAAQDRAKAARLEIQPVPEEGIVQEAALAPLSQDVYDVTPQAAPHPQEENWFEQAIDWVTGKSDEPDADIAAEQRELSAMGLYVSEGHQYYADGIAGDVTEHARRLRDDEDYGLRYLEERLSDENFLGSISDGNHEKEVMMLEAAINRSRQLQGLGVMPVDGVLDADMLAAVEQYKNDYEVEELTQLDKAVDFVREIVAPSPVQRLREREEERALEAPMNDRQERVTGIMAAAAEKFGVPVELMVGIWHHETRFSCGDLTSSTGCQGDWQFERATMRNVVRKYGDDMEAVLREQGQTDMADAVADIQRRLLHGQRVSNEELDAFRNSPEISTVAAAALMRDNAGSLRLGKTIEQNEYGLIYAGYNGGLQVARAMRDGGVIRDEEFLRNNTVGSVNETHEAQRAHYDNAVREGIERGGSLIAAAEQGITRDAPTTEVSFQTAAVVLGEGPERARERIQLTNRFDASAQGFDFNDMLKQGAEMVQDGIENVQGFFRQIRLPTLTV